MRGRAGPVERRPGGSSGSVQAGASWCQAGHGARLRYPGHPLALGRAQAGPRSSVSPALGAVLRRPGARPGPGKRPLGLGMLRPGSGGRARRATGGRRNRSGQYFYRVGPGQVIAAERAD